MLDPGTGDWRSPPESRAQPAMPYMAQPRLKLGAAEAHLRLREHARERALVQQVLAGKPNLAEARALLQRIDG